MLLSTLFLYGALHAAPDTAALARIADSLASARLRDSVAGVVIAVYHHGRPVLRRAWGTADADMTRALTADDMLPVGSITKQFAAVAALRLVDAGRVDLDAPAGRYLPQLGGSARDVTVRQLLNQRSGLGRFEMLMRGRAATRESVVAVIDSLPRTFAPGARFEYNNANYYLLGAIIERVSGMPWEAYVETALLAPLGMTHTRRCAGSGDGGIAGWAQLGAPTAPRRRGPPVPTVLLEAAGAICSTVDDLARWSAALHGGRVLTAAAYTQLVTPPDTTTRPAYAMGTVAQPVDGHRRFWHNGAITSGFNAQLAHYPDDSLTVVVLANTYPARPEEIEGIVARTALGLAIPAPRAAAERPVASGPALPLAAYAATYATGPLRFTVRVQGEGLELVDPSNRTIPLAARDGTRFCGVQDATFCVEFAIEHGRPAVLTVDSPRAKAPPARRVE